MSDSLHKERYPWSSREIEILIALWDNEEVLYNTRCADYFKRDKRIEALDRISDTLKIPIPEIRKKMTNLRTYYGKELWKEKKAQTNGDETDPAKGYTSRWLFFKPLSFLRDNCNPRPNTKTCLDEQCIRDDSGDQVYVLHNGEDDSNDRDDSWDESNLLASLTSVDDEKEERKEDKRMNSVSSEHKQDNRPVSKKTEKRKKSGGDLENVIAKLQRSSKTETQKEQKNQGVSITELMSGNPDMVFAHHVGLTLMNITNPRIKDLTKLKIQQVLYETQYVKDTPQSVQACPITGLPGSTC
ncbi:uncharacterized protein LOC116293884 [Actinia tenebrosa]|uniref:Uncharacterized protein LOC116293884 n=1 Tax=Actinia tenebrosa TaxID=6105 RepID=A0A6P8HNI5_ACTTE|nr:uncharacterized protein LOC116293884 [Actinia tenebrosa]